MALWQSTDKAAVTSWNKMNTDVLIQELFNSLRSPEQVINPAAFKETQRHVLEVILTNPHRIQEVQAYQIIRLLETFHNLLSEPVMFSCLNVLLSSSHLLENSELFALYKFLLNFGPIFRAEMVKIMEQLLVRAGRNKLDDLQLLQLITWLIDNPSESLKYSLHALYTSIRNHQLQKTNKRTKKMFGMLF